MSRADIGEEHHWHPSRQHARERWRKTRSGWVREKKGRLLSELGDGLSPEAARREQQEIWSAYQDAVEDSDHRAADRLFRVWLLHQRQYDNISFAMEKHFHVLFDQSGLKKGVSAQPGEIRIWSTGPKHTPERWQRQQEGWRRVAGGGRLGKNAPKQTFSHDHLLNQQRDLWRTYRESVDSGDHEGAAAVFDSFQRHSESYPTQILPGELLGHVEIPEHKIESYSSEDAFHETAKFSALAHAFSQRDDSWATRSARGTENLRSPERVVSWLNGEEGQSRLVKGVASFGEFESEESSPGSGFENFIVRDRDYYKISSKASRDFRTLLPGGVGEFDTIDEDSPVLMLHNNILVLQPEGRGRDFSAQLYLRQEDFLKEATKSLPDKEKKNVIVGMYADVNIGKYYWMTQGYRYQNNESREEHLRSLAHVLDSMDPNLPKYSQGGERAPVLDEKGKRSSLTEAGYSAWDLEVVREALKVSIKNAQDPESHNDDLIEPWEVLQLSSSGPSLYVENDEYLGGKSESKYIPCSLMKFLALHADSWPAVKHVHVPTDRDKEGELFGSVSRAKNAERAAKRDSPWAWLGNKANEALRNL